MTDKKPAQCQTCGATNINPIIVCDDCDPERFYYQGQRWRAAAMAAREAFLPRWWERLLRRQRALPSAFDGALTAALELEEEHKAGEGRG